MRVNNINQLPNELLFEVATYLPLRSMHSFFCTSRRARALGQDDWFVENMYQQRFMEVLPVTLKRAEESWQASYQRCYQSYLHDAARKLASNEIPEEIKAYKGYWLSILSRHGELIEFASDAFKADRDILLAALKGCDEQSHPKYPTRDDILCSGLGAVAIIENASPDLMFDKDVMSLAVSKNGMVLKYASEVLKSDKELVEQAFYQHYRALQFASKTLRSDKDFMMILVTHQPLAFRYACQSLKADRDLLFAALMDCDDILSAHRVLQSANNVFRKDMRFQSVISIEDDEQRIAGYMRLKKALMIESGELDEDYDELELNVARPAF